MRIVETYSHLNGLEYLLVHKPKLWHELQNVIKAVDAVACKTKISKEKGKFLNNIGLHDFLNDGEVTGKHHCKFFGY